MFGATKKPHHSDTGICLYAGFERLSHKNRRILGAGSLADTAHHCLYYHCYCHNLPHLETQA